MLDAQTINSGWESNHQRLKKHQTNDTDRWRLRDWVNHPNDPGWESGTYDSCHKKLRRKVQIGDAIFDTVYPGNPTETEPVIRSAFVIKDGSDGELFFDEFIFLDDDPEDGIRGQIHRGHKSLNEKQVEEYLKQIDNCGAYTRYSTGNKPESVLKEDWQKMITKSEGDSICPSCSNNEPDDDCTSDGGCG